MPEAPYYSIAHPEGLFLLLRLKAQVPGDIPGVMALKNSE
jgi:hypothetical protein